VGPTVKQRTPSLETPLGEGHAEAQPAEPT